MPSSTLSIVHRPEFLSQTEVGGNKIRRLMAGTARCVKAGDVLVHAQTEHRYVYRVQNGWLARNRTLGDGRNQLILIFLPGDFFALKSMFLNRHPDAITAISDAVVERLDYRDLHSAFLKDGDVASRCIFQVMEEERRLHNWVVGLGQGSADERVAMLMVELRARLAAAGVIERSALVFPLPLTQVQLGDYLGLTSVHVNRVLRILREERLITVRDGVARIDSMRRLYERAFPLMDTFERADPDFSNPDGECA